ncbi:MAG: hypothetical protein Q8N10_04590 [Phenylobacterium sp.]|uniref:hypothetical protein n=1 Tax=Phenylobacterium sp. TaxID=1871053 RepID=UPI00271B3E6E|nr:hypothetical protein [Phenylobacterium sp.]MDO8913998.1 hypothetical protein [Phenylobacterium sp.]MDP3099762.1 hypothetical protein [Phenylobacterium sp.]
MTLTVTRLPFGTTLARQMARQNLTRFNHVFWVGERGYDHLASGFVDIKFPSPAPHLHGIYTSDADWRSAVAEHQIWTRQYILVSAASLLEVYITSAARSALAAHPELIEPTMIGKDGYLFLMGKRAPPAGWNRKVKERVATFTKGLWSKRLAELASVFGPLPVQAVTLEPALQKLQNTRNEIAHEFGLDGPTRQAQWEPINHIALTRQDCEAAIRTVSAFIAAVDKPVFGPLIGGHEILFQYHLWAQANPKASSWHVAGRAAGLFRDHIGAMTSHALGADYAWAIANYYHQL